MSSPASTPDSPPRRLGLLARRLVRLGVWRATTLITLGVMVLAAGICEAVVAVAGHGDRTLVAASVALCALLLAPPLVAVAVRLALELDKTRQLVAVLATQDDLTGVCNRRHFMAVVQREWERARRYGTAAALLLVDADHFRRVNDAHGHLCGDELLRSIASTVGASLRQADLLARFGGEELIVFLPHTDPLGALDVAERIRARVQSLSIEWNGTKVSTTVSIGVAPMRNELPSLDWMIHEADTALYAAKADGRNCVRTLPFEASRSGGAFPVNLR